MKRQRRDPDRTIRVEVTMTPEQYERLTAVAGTAGLSRAAFLAAAVDLIAQQPQEVPLPLAS